MGGTLSKLVYFEQTRKSRSVERVTNSKRRFRYFEDPKKSAMKRSQSLENLNTPRWVGGGGHGLTEGRNHRGVIAPTID